MFIFNFCLLFYCIILVRKEIVFIRIGNSGSNGTIKAKKK